MNPIHTHPHYFFKVNFSNIFPPARNFSTRAVHDFRTELRATCPTQATSFSLLVIASRSRRSSLLSILFSKTLHTHTQQQVKVLIQIKYETVKA
jgi:hypothetical protein